MTAQELLEVSEIADFLETHQGAAEEIRNAASLLAEKKDAVTAMKKILPALSQKQVKVFFSYKIKDKRAAKKIVDVLRINSADKLSITYQDDFTQYIVGKQWREQINNAVRSANWFILLLPDPSADWDWCLYETGLFEAQHTSADLLICLHHPDTNIPNPIEGYHGVAATLPEVEKFLRKIFIGEDPVYGMKPINPAIESKIPEIANEIVEAIRPPRKTCFREIFEPWVQLSIKAPKDLQNKDDLDTSLVKSVNSAALDVFGFIQQPPTWGELRSGLKDISGDDRWREELFHVIRKIASGRKFYPVQAVFQTAEGNFYRPIVCAVDRDGETGPIDVFHITFTESITQVDTTVIPEELSLLAIILRMTFRFRWEVLEKFGRGAIAEDDIERLNNSLTRLQIDAESRGLRGEVFMDAVMKLFPPQKAQRILEMFNDWLKVRNPDETGELDTAIKTKNAEKIPQILSRFIPVNQEFLELAADRFSELVSNR